jgi:CRISPR-associated protein Cmr2
MSPGCYTAITFAPVQGFIEKSRKLRDLYGSSFILSYLANELCKKAREHFGVSVRPNFEVRDDPVITPALIKIATGTPNQIIIRGTEYFPYQKAKESFDTAWKQIVEGCRTWVETNVLRENGQFFGYCWRREWNLWLNHAWEFFWATGSNISEARQALNEVKRKRAWVGVNWTGESSTLSGADGIAWPGMGIAAPINRNLTVLDNAIREFYKQLSLTIETNNKQSIINEREQLSIPELIKRLITIEAVAQHKIGIPDNELPSSFKALNRHRDEDEPDVEIERTEPLRYSGWFQGDGDKAGDYFKQLEGKSDEDPKTHIFSKKMREWGATLESQLPRFPKQHKSLDRDGRIVYAGGDDFMGVLYRNPPEPPLSAYECLEWFYTFKNDIWSQHEQPITPSVGFVWAAPNVPQRDVLQHCHQAERSAKNKGRDRIALRVLFNSGNYLEWVCPWWFLPVLKNYRDRNNQKGKDANWSHIYDDIATLESRHALEKQTQVALAIFEVYFDKHHQEELWNHRWDTDNKSGILGNQSQNKVDDIKSLNEWVINLAKVGFYLCQQ